MKRNTRAWAVILWAVAMPVLAQKATELYVPIGASPGVSGKLTVIAPVDSADPAAKALHVDNRLVRIDERTRIWIDRSKLRQPSGVGTMADLKAGRMAEVRFRGDDAAGAMADWIKVEPPPP